jgi:hypothetical protein
MLIYHMAVSSLANRKRLFNSKTTEFLGVMNYGVGNEKQVKQTYPERWQSPFPAY